MRRLFILVLLFVSGAVFAQEGRDDNYRRNLVKINVSSLLFNNYSFTAERSLTRKISFLAGYRFQPYKTVWDRSFIKSAVTSVASFSDKTVSDIDATQFSNQAFTGQFRFYAGKRSGARGFYLGLYGRYATFDMYLPTFSYMAGDGIIYRMPVHAKLNGLGGGFVIGAQWWIARRVSIDLSLLGAHYGRLGGSLTADKDLSALSDRDRAGIKASIEETYTYGDKKFIDATVSPTGINARVNGPFAGSMAGSLNIGIIF